MFLFWGKDLLCFYNDAYRPSLGNDGKHPLIAKGGKESWPEIWHFIGPLIEKVMTTGEAVWFEDQFLPIYRNRKMEDVYWTFSYSPAYGDDSTIQGVFVTCTETTSKVIALNELKETHSKIEKSQEQLVTYFEQSPVAIATLSKENLTFRLVNPFYGELVGRKPGELENKPLLEALPEIKGQGFDDLLREVISTGKPFIAEEVAVDLKRKGKLETIYVNLTYQPQRDTRGDIVGILVVATDVTQQVQSRKKVEESEARFRNLLQEAPVAATLFRGPELIIEVANDLTLKYWGKNKNIIGKPLSEAVPELEDQQMIALVKGVYERGGIASFAETPLQFIENGVLKDGFYSFSFKALYNSNGDVESVLSTGIEVTAQVNARKQIEQSEKELRDLISAAPIGICVLSGVEARIEEVNERFILISGKKPEQYVNATYWEVFPEVAEAFAPVLENVFKTGIKFTTQEAELVLIRRGVPETMFATFEYIPVFDVDDNSVTKIIVMVVEVTHQVETRKEIEQAVIERTKELGESNLRLKRSNEELEQFAYIASHDLQEPVRKISTFTQMLELSIKEISPKSQDYISKIFSSTDRMTKLIRDVLAFSRIKEEANDFESVDLNGIIELLKTDFELQIEESGATVKTLDLPVIEAIQPQIIQLFSNLLSNSLKFRRQGVKPVIKISASVAEKEKVAKRFVLDNSREYYHIEFSDNGIGFSEDHVDRIFRIFQRLHRKTEFEGTGIGLAICRRIVQNHHGHISAAVGDNGGAVFNILLPTEQSNSASTSGSNAETH
jgi:PAS domain S-box-containing protein